MQPGGTCAYPTAQPRTDVLVVLAIVAQATPCLTPRPSSRWTRSAADVDDFTPKHRCINIRAGPLARWTITGGGQAVNYANPG